MAEEKKECHYYTRDCINLIKKLYPFIPRGIIKRVLHGEEVYMFYQGIVEEKPTYEDFKYN